MAFLLVGCGPAVVPIGGGGSSSSGDEPPPLDSTATEPRPPAPSGSTSGGSTSRFGSDSSAADDDASTGSTGAGFITDPETTCGIVPDGVQAHCSACSPISQDCRPGDACRAWANDGGDEWNATRCTPVSDDAGGRGDPCTVEGSNVSGVDTCDAGLMCWNVDPDTLEGTCVEYCEVGFVCDDPSGTCSVFNEGTLPLCLPTCNPLMFDCGEGFGCYPTTDFSFVCLREDEPVHASGVSQPDCAPGTFWAWDEQIDGCTDEESCCVAYCDRSGPPTCDVDEECAMLVPEPSPEFEDLGYCRPGA